MRNIVVLIPGIMGSRLTHKNAAGKVEEIWPGSPGDLIFPYKDFDKLNDATEGAIKATDIIRSSVIDVYGKFIEYLGTIGFRETGTPQSLWVYPYDWRVDNARSAQGLADLLTKIGSEKPEEEKAIHLIAHSMGGLVARYYLESTAFNAHPQKKLIKSLITLGTPHRGSPFALSAALGKEKRLFLSAKQVSIIANNPAFAALYQLMPTTEPFAWDGSPDRVMEPLDFETLTTKLSLQPVNAKAAVTFYNSLKSMPSQTGVRYFFFYGTRIETPTATRVRLSPVDREIIHWKQEGAGDGTVPIWSAHISGVQGYPVGGEHGSLFKDNSLRRMLENLLPTTRVLLAKVDEATLHLMKQVVEPTMGQSQAQLELTQATNTMSGTVEVIEVDINPTTGAVVQEKRTASARNFNYTGASIDMLRFLFVIPSNPGVYYLRINIDAPFMAKVDDIFIVQQP